MIGLGGLGGIFQGIAQARGAVDGLRTQINPFAGIAGSAPPPDAMAGQSPSPQLPATFGEAIAGLFPETAPSLGAATVAADSPSSPALVPSTARGYQPDLDNLQSGLRDRLGGLQSAWGRDLPIVSGYRSPARNAAAGGARRSQHMHGNAVDIDVSGLSPDERVALIGLASKQGFTGLGVYDNSLHLDLGGRRAWGPSHGRESVPKWAENAIQQHLAATGEQAASVPSPQRPAAPAIRDAIASIESAGSGDYRAIGTPNRRLGRPLGRYQIMEANLPAWSREILGREVAPDEFLASPDLQDAIFDGKFGQYIDQYGLAGAAQAWFAGPGGVGRPDRTDELGTSVQEYGRKFLSALGRPASEAFSPPRAGQPGRIPPSVVAAAQRQGEQDAAGGPERRRSGQQGLPEAPLPDPGPVQRRATPYGDIAAALMQGQVENSGLRSLSPVARIEAIAEYGAGLAPRISS